MGWSQASEAMSAASALEKQRASVVGVLGTGLRSFGLLLLFLCVIEPIPDDSLKEKFLKPLKGSSVFTFVCVCLSVRGLQSTHFDIGT